MSRVYTVKSNARRDCRKLGLNPDLVKPVAGGWAIDYPDVPGAKAAKPAKDAKAKKSPRVSKPKKDKPQKATKKPREKREGDPKKDRLVSMLAGWTPLSDLMEALEWQAHTVRGALSTAAKARSLTIERRRVDGVTSYRVAVQ